MRQKCCVKLNPEDCGWFLCGHLKRHMVCSDPILLLVEDVLRESEPKDSADDLE